jgi:hypothetical protein
VRAARSVTLDFLIRRGAVNTSPGSRGSQQTPKVLIPANWRLQSHWRGHKPKLMKRAVSQETRMMSIGMDIEPDCCSCINQSVCRISFRNAQGFGLERTPPAILRPESLNLVVDGVHLPVWCCQMRRICKFFSSICSITFATVLRSRSRASFVSAPCSRIFGPAK